MTIEDLYAEVYPPQNRYVVTFTSKHKIVGGGYCTQNQRRFILADSPEQAMAFFRNGELSRESWDGDYHSWSNLHAQCVPDCAVYVGYFRFGQDCRELTISA